MDITAPYEPFDDPAQAEIDFKDIDGIEIGIAIEMTKMTIAIPILVSI